MLGGSSIRDRRDRPSTAVQVDNLTRELSQTVARLSIDDTSATGRTIYSVTGTGGTRQISSAYSLIVRSEEK